MATGDVSNAFYCMEFPDSLFDRFTMPGVLAGVLGLTELDGLPVSPSEVILPCLSVLPMGWTWVLRLCQAVTEQCVREEVGDHALVQDRRPGIVVGPSVLACAACVDNFGICGANPTEVDRALERVSTRLSDMGITVHELHGTSQHLHSLHRPRDLRWPLPSQARSSLEAPTRY